MLPRASLAALALSLLSCAASFKQVPAGEPHGLVHIRLVHPEKDLVYESEASLDFQPRVSLRKGRETSVRLGPGKHQLELHATVRRYDLGTESSYYANAGDCVGTSCNVRLGKTEQRTAVVESYRKECKQALTLDVLPNSESVALLVVAADNTCTACVVGGKTATRCP